MKAYLRRPAVIVLVCAALLAVGGGIAYASIPDGDGMIHACAAKRDGVLRVIDTDAGGACNAAKENPLNWNQQGTAGVGARTFDAVVPVGSTLEILTLDNGLKLSGGCQAPADVWVIANPVGAETVSAFGWMEINNGAGDRFETVESEQEPNFGFGGYARFQAHVAVRRHPADGSPTPYDEIDIIARAGTPCRFTGTITPTT